MRKRGLTIDECLHMLQELSDENSSATDEDGIESEDDWFPQEVSVSSDSEADVDANYDTNNDDANSSTRNGNDSSITSTSSAYIAKDGTVWNIAPASQRGRLSKQNVLRIPEGPTSYALRAITDGNVLSSWRLFINEKMLKHIKKCTEVEARRRTGNNEWHVSLDELDAFISLLYARGTYEAKNIELESLWDNLWGIRIFPDTMSRNRFREIMRYIRFDIKSTRKQRLADDKFALVSEIWNQFIENCISLYNPGENLTIDEQLFPTKARCKFIQYMPQKPDKFGIKFWLLADVDTKYLLNGFPYLGKNEDRPSNQNLSEYVVLRLMKPYFNKGYNITTDNFFTSLRLAENLKSKKTSIVGTVNRGRKEIPQAIKNEKNALFSSKVLAVNDISLTVSQGKNKSVFILSSLHSSVTVENDDKQLPETVKFYNSTKFGVDILDQMTRKYTTKACSRRWPLQVFYNVLDLAGINSWILYKKVTGKNIRRRDFLLQLTCELREPYVNSMQLSKISLPNKVLLSDEASGRKRKRCQSLDCKGNKTMDKCEVCGKPTCGKCTAKVVKNVFCGNCVKNIN